MYKKIILATIAILIAAGGYLVLSGTDERPSTTQTNNSNTPTAISEAEFNPLPINESFIATVAITNSEESYTGTLENDGKGTTRFSTTTNGASIDFYYLESGYIVCQNSECYTMPDTTSATGGFDVDEFSFKSDDIDKIRSTSTFVTTQPCDSGSCNVWSFTDEEGNSGTMYIAVDSSKIVKIESNNTDNSSATITYSYEPVDIKLPETTKELGLPSGSGL